jgi:hypothetical protein
VASALMLGVSAQFQFFEQMFNGGQGQQQQQRNVGSDSTWFRENYEAGGLRTPPSFALADTMDRSALLKLPLPRDAVLRPLPPPLPVRVPGPGGQGGAERGEHVVREQRRVRRRGIGAQGGAGAEGAAMTYGSLLDDSVTPLDGMAFGMAFLAIEGFGCAIRLRLGSEQSKRSKCNNNSYIHRNA